MKLVRYSLGEEPPHFGIVVGDRAVSLAALQRASGNDRHDVADSRAYLSGLPDTERVARELLDWCGAHLDRLDERKRPLLDTVRLHEPVEVAALFDFGLTPRHLRNSADTLLRYERDDPQTGPIVEAFRRMLLGPPPAGAPARAERLSYYKCNMNSITGDGAVVPWPAYTSRLDIEPELAVVHGNARQPVAGYCIFNDVSARDVQAAEIIGGFCLTKDMARGNQLGPCLVTADEVGDPRALDVSVVVDGSVRFRGSTSEISRPPEEVLAWLGGVCPLKPGTVIGLGTIPDCTGLDHDDFLDPGADISITIERLGTLRCRFDRPVGPLLPSRWPLRASLLAYHR